MNHYEGDTPLNIGTGEDLSILDLARRIGDVVGFAGDIVLDRSKPDGTPRKLLDVSKLSALGWRARIGLEEGLRETYRWYVEREAAGAEVASL
jgi:GDP-L-fucose synthase